MFNLSNHIIKIPFKYIEEHMLLCILDYNLEQYFQLILKKKSIFWSDDEDISLHLEGDIREGCFLVYEKRYSLYFQTLSTTIETYITLNIMNLIKIGEISRMMIVRSKILLLYGDIENGLSPIMMRQRHQRFQNQEKIKRTEIKKIENALQRVLYGRTPRRVIYIDTEEVWTQYQKDYKG